jgi:hypothetical protein
MFYSNLYSYFKFPLNRKNKFKSVDPIDYDSYIEKNIPLLSKDTYSKQLILLPSDDLSAEFLEFKGNNHTHDSINEYEQPIKLKDSNLFVKDCLKTYENKKYEIKYKYHEYGGNYRQLPDYVETNFDTIDIKAPLLLPELFYEIDAEAHRNAVNSMFYFFWFINLNLNLSQSMSNL